MGKTVISAKQIGRINVVLNGGKDEDFWRIKITTSGKSAQVFPAPKDVYLQMKQFDEESKEMIRRFVRQNP